MRACASSLLLAAILLPGAATAEFLDDADVAWKVNEHEVSRWKTLVGGNEGGQIPADDIQFGTWELAPGAIYHRHRHDAPEIYFIVDGEALWTVGDETRTVTAGTVIHTKPGEEHRMENRTDAVVKAIWIWWAPGGDASVFSGSYEFTEPAPPEPNGQGFSEGNTERLY